MTFDHRRPGLSQQLWLLGFNLWVWQRGAPFFVGSEDRSGRLDPWNPGSLEPAVGLQSLLNFHAGLTFWINILQVWSRDHASTRIASPRIWFSYLPAMLTQFWLEIASQLHHGDNAGKQLGRTRSVPVILFAPEPFLSENSISSRCLWIWIYICFCWWNLQVFYFPSHFCLEVWSPSAGRSSLATAWWTTARCPTAPCPTVPRGTGAPRVSWWIQSSSETWRDDFGRPGCPRWNVGVMTGKSWPPTTTKSLRSCKQSVSGIPGMMGARLVASSSKSSGMGIFQQHLWGFSYIGADCQQNRDLSSETWWLKLSKIQESHATKVFFSTIKDEGGTRTVTQKRLLLWRFQWNIHLIAPLLMFNPCVKSIPVLDESFYPAADKICETPREGLDLENCPYPRVLPLLQSYSAIPGSFHLYGYESKPWSPRYPRIAT